MEQIVLVPASVYNKILNTQSFTKQELPKYQAMQNHTSQNHSLKKEINKKIFAKTDCILDKNLSCPFSKLSCSRTLNLVDVETGVLLSNFAQQLHRKNADLPHMYVTLVDATGVPPTVVLN